MVTRVTHSLTLRVILSAGSTPPFGAPEHQLSPPPPPLPPPPLPRRQPPPPLEGCCNVVGRCSKCEKKSGSAQRQGCRRWWWCCFGKRLMVLVRCWLVLVLVLVLVVLVRVLVLVDICTSRPTSPHVFRHGQCLGQQPLQALCKIHFPAIDPMGSTAVGPSEGIGRAWPNKKQSFVVSSLSPRQTAVKFLPT